jgi:hypothetical protein
MGYLTELESTIQHQVELLECLKKRVSLLESKTDISEYEENENTILIIKTNSEINSLTQIVYEKQKYFEKYAAEFDHDYEEMEKNYIGVMATALKEQHKNENLQRLLKTPDLETIENDREAKVWFYKRVLSLLNEG